jgi:hypothetical protein
MTIVQQCDKCQGTGRLTLPPALGSAEYVESIPDERLREIAEEIRFNVLVKHFNGQVASSEFDAISSTIQSVLARALRAHTGARENALTEALRECFCPRPANGRPDDETVGSCVDSDLCGCVCGWTIMSPEQRAAREAPPSPGDDRPTREGK